MARRCAPSSSALTHRLALFAAIALDAAALARALGVGRVAVATAVGAALALGFVDGGLGVLGGLNLF